MARDHLLITAGLDTPNPCKPDTKAHARFEAVRARLKARKAKVDDLIAAKAEADLVQRQPAPDFNAWGSTRVRAWKTAASVLQRQLVNRSSRADDIRAAALTLQSIGALSLEACSTIVNGDAS